MTSMRNVSVGSVALLAALLFAGCAGTAGSGSNDPVGTWGDDSDAESPSLSLTDDGSFSGTDGCNQLNGSWTAEDDTVQFSDVASTQMFCEGVDTWLAGLTEATIAGSTMTVVGADGSEIGTLERSGGGAPSMY